MFSVYNQMNEKLLIQEDKEFYPFQSPPSFQKALKHQKAVSVGFESSQKTQTCLCCDKIIEKQPIPLCCGQQNLLFLGVGYPLLYTLTKAFSTIILFVFVISGSAFYFMVTLKCQHFCLRFMGVPIINLQMPNEQMVRVTEVANMITAVGIFILVLYEITNFQNKQICASQYSIMLQNLPDQITREELQSWIKQQFKKIPLKINLAYDVSELQRSYQKRHNLTIQLNKKLISINTQKYTEIELAKINQQINNLRQELGKQDRILLHYKQLNIQCNTVGTAFVSFQKSKSANTILEQYQTSFVGSVLSYIFSIVRTPTLTFKDRNVLVFRAPAPSQVIWENLGFSYIRSIIAELIFIIIMVILILLAFKIQFFFVQYAYKLRVAGSSTGEILILFQAIMMSIIVIILNSLLRIVIKEFVKIKKYYSFTKLETSFCFYYSLFYIFNSCFMIYIVHGKAIQDSDDLLLYDIHIIMLANAFSEPLFKLFDPLMWIRVFWREYVGRLKSDKNPYTQAYVNNLWEGYEISSADNYQYVTRTLFITIWFAHSAPLGVVFSLIGLLIDYWIGKYLLLRIYKKPKHLSQQIAYPIVRSLQLLPLVYICGVLQFTYKVATTTNLFDFLYQFLNYGITTIIICLSVLGYFIFFRSKLKQYPQAPYSKVQIFFDSNYQIQNPMTKYQGEINELYNLLKHSHANQEDTKKIQDLLESSRNSNQQFLNRKSQIQKIKKRTVSKLGNSFNRSNQLQLKEIPKD